MNNAPVTLILIASLGLIAVISLGVFFAVRPRTTITTTWFKFTDGSSAEKSHSAEQTDSTTVTSTTFIPSTILLTTEPPQSMKPLGTDWFTPPRRRVSPTSTAPPILTTRKHYSPTSPMRFTKKLQAFPSEVDLQRIGDIPGHQSLSEGEIEMIDEVTHPESALPPTFLPVTGSLSHNQPINWVSELKLADQGRIVGLAYRNKHLFAASIRNGNITVLSTPELKIVDRIPCPNCHAYDVAVFSNGEIIVAQGKRRKLTKISRTKRIVRELDLSYATKGLAVSPWKSSRRYVYVLARSHDKIYKYDWNLNPSGTVHIPNESRDDCNFLAVGNNDTLYVSCENAVFVIGTRGNLIRVIKPQKGSYSVGIGVDELENILVVRRGKTQIDVFDRDGVFRKTIGPDNDILWSDLAVGGGHVYIIDYMGMTLKAMKYP